MNASISSPNALPSHRNGVAARNINIYKRRSPPRSTSNMKEINFAYVDSQILQRPKTSKRSTPAETYDASSTSLYPEFEIDAYASNEDLIKAFVSTNA